MKIALISEWFSERMGYAENLLPKALAKLGYEVHLITTNTQIYFNQPFYSKVYEPHLGPGIVDCGSKVIDGFTVHRLPHFLFRGQVGIKDLKRILYQLRPQIVQTFDVHSWITLQAAVMQPFFRYRLFLESHIHASVLHSEKKSGLKSAAKTEIRWLRGNFLSRTATMCYPISEDAAQIVVDHFHINPRIVKTIPLGVDTDLFFPVRSENDEIHRNKTRARLGFCPEDIVTIYTGRLSIDKNPLCLAKAIGILNKTDSRFKALFLGEGPQKAEISAVAGCTVHPFVPAEELPGFYRASDLGVWPRQESTSQIDAAVCGIPIIISDQTRVPERVDQNGLTYIQDDAVDLAVKIQTLQDAEMRTRMGKIGSQRLSAMFSWEKIAMDRLLDYQSSLM